MTFYSLSYWNLKTDNINTIESNHDRLSNNLDQIIQLINDSYGLLESLPQFPSLLKANLDSARESTKELSKVINRRIDFSMLPRDVLFYMSEWLVEKDRCAAASVCKATRGEMKGCYLENSCEYI